MLGERLLTLSICVNSPLDAIGEATLPSSTSLAICGDAQSVTLDIHPRRGKRRQGCHHMGAAQPTSRTNLLHPTSLSSPSPS